jgi:hypothetical protein
LRSEHGIGDAVATVTEYGVTTRMTRNWTDTGQAGLAPTERRRPGESGARVDLRQQFRELLFEDICLLIELGVTTFFGSIVLVLAAADYATVDRGARI